jgi:hypothetical protein
MSRRALALAFLAVAATAPLAGCGDDDKSLPAACTEGPRPVARALERAPNAVRLSDGSSISNCVERAKADADIQTVGSIFTRVADGLSARMPTSDKAALQLGYLIAAVRKGGRHTTGIHEEMVRRVEQAVGLDGAPPARRAAIERGLAAGERSG